jgi:CRISPR system Cascade subunit CasD
MGNILLLRLEGPLQSWGARARWDVRDTALEPTKSGIIGLLGCALGLPRGDALLLQLDKDLRFGVRTEHPGRVITDYQTITDFLPTAAGDWKGRDSRTRSPADMRAAGAKPATIISPRDYLEDAAFLVALEARAGGEELLQRAADALQAPRWPLFLGRKSCVPTRPIFEEITDRYADLKEALNTHPWEWGLVGSRRRPKPERPLEAWVEAVHGEENAVRRQDAIRLNAARVYDFRLARRLPPIAFASLNTPAEVSP